MRRVLSTLSTKTANYVTTIANEIDNSKIILFLASANSYASKYVGIEVHYAFNHNVTVLPYALDQTPIPKDFLRFLEQV